ncbi:MAG: YybH family protein [Pyrinomonadaceae bacterium]
MKVCPNCKTKYDDSVDVCPNDGTLLVEVPDSNDEPSHELTEKQREQLEHEKKVERERREEERRERELQYEAQEAADSSASSSFGMVILTIIGTLALIAFGIWLGTSLLTGNSDNSNLAQPSDINIRVDETQKKTVETKELPAREDKQDEKKPLLNENKSVTLTDPTVINAEINADVNEWQAAVETADANALNDLYATEVDFYGNEGAAKSEIIKMRKKLASEYDSVDVEISNVKVTPASDGETATVVFDRTWKYQGSDKMESGKAQTQLVFKNIDGKWQIISERDLKKYPNAE